MNTDAFADRLATFRAVARLGQTVEGVAASLAEEIGFIRDDCRDTGHGSARLFYLVKLQ
jgi:hypothetical protein